MTELLALEKTLNSAGSLLRDGDVKDAFFLLGPELSALYDSLHQSDERERARALVQNSLAYELVSQDPYTTRARNKPRGFPGDARMLDYVYDGVGADAGISELGRAVLQATTRGPMGLSVLFRRSLLRAHIDETVATRRTPRILSVASGHCREVQGSLVEAPDFLGEFVAIDQDALACEVVRQRHKANRVSVVEASVKSLVTGRVEGIGQFDLIYSAGLYDYLAEPFATRLTSALGQLLRSDGKLVIANFLPQCQGRGYIDWFMDWQLLFRDEASVARLARVADGDRVSSHVDPHSNVAYATLDRE